MTIETPEQLEKAIAAIKNYQAAVRKVESATRDMTDKLNLLRNATGATTVDEAVAMVGHTTINGLPERR